MNAMKKINQLTKTRLKNQSLYRSQTKQFNKPTKKMKKETQMKTTNEKMELETQPTDKENEMHSNEEKMNSELETQQSRETSSKETFQKADKANEDPVSQNFIGSEEKVNQQQKEILYKKIILLTKIRMIWKMKINNHQRQRVRSYYNQQTKKMILTKKTIQLIHNKKK